MDAFYDIDEGYGSTAKVLINNDDDDVIIRNLNDANKQKKHIKELFEQNIIPSDIIIEYINDLSNKENILGITNQIYNNWGEELLSSERVKDLIQDYFKTVIKNIYKDEDKFDQLLINNTYTIEDRLSRIRYEASKLKQYNIKDIDEIVTKHYEAVDEKLNFLQKGRQDEIEKRKRAALYNEIEIDLINMLDELNIQSLNKMQIFEKAKRIQIDKKELDRIALNYYYIINGKKPKYLLFYSTRYDHNGMYGWDFKKVANELKKYFESMIMMTPRTTRFLIKQKFRYQYLEMLSDFFQI